MVRYFSDSLSRSICWYACDKSKIFPLAKVANRSSGLGNRYLSTLRASFIASNFIITTQPHLSVLLGYQDYRGCPIRVVNFLEYSCILKPVYLSLYGFFQGEGYWARSVEAWCRIFLYSKFSSNGVHGPQLILKNVALLIMQ